MGRIYVGVEEGQILRYAADGSGPQVFADTGGRPLGLDFDLNGNLIVADAAKGLLSIDPTGAIAVLVHGGGRSPARLHRRRRRRLAERRLVLRRLRASGAHHDVMNAALESRAQRPTGSSTISVPASASAVLGDLYFANGSRRLSGWDLCLGQRNDALSNAKRVYVRGPRTGVVEVFIDNLPGFPDGISTGADGVYWLALYAPRNALLDSAGPTPWLRAPHSPNPRRPSTQASATPLRAWASTPMRKVVRNLQDADGKDFSKSTSAEQVGDTLYVGSLTEPKWGRLRPILAS